MYYLVPTRALQARDTSTGTSSSSTSSGECVECPATAQQCPVCPTGQVCIQQARTCQSCTKYVCQAQDSLLGSTTPVGGIVGGVIGFLAVAAILGFLYYKFVYRKKHPRLLDDYATSEIELDAEDTETGKYDVLSGSGEKFERPMARRTELSLSVTKNHRLSAYESFMRPQAKYAKRPVNAPRKTNSLGNISAGGNYGPYIDDNQFKRNSVATSISTTNASNILPVAYIPGVTIRPTKNNTQSIYSYETDSVFSEMNGIENALIVADRHGGSQSKGTMTAIKAQPRLVNVTRIDEGDEENGDDDDNVSEESARPGAAVEQGMSHVFRLQEAGADPDSDVDSDIGEIGEIHRATSVRRPEQPPTHLKDNHSGLFVLDIARDNR